VTRRLSLAIIGMVLASLLLTGLGTLALANIGAEAAIEEELSRQAESFAAGAAASNPRGGVEGLPPLEQFESVARGLTVDGIGLLITLPNGQLRGDLPVPLTVGDLDLDALGAGETITGSVGTTVFAAAPAERTDVGTLVVVLTREEEPLLGDASRWFLVASGVTVVVAALLSVRLGRRLVRPVRQAGRVTQRIARGDLGARLPEPPTRARDELSELTRSINAMADSLQRSQGLERQFLLSVSHDLRTPLTSIRGYAEAIADGAAPDNDRAAEIILGESRRLQRLVQDLLDLARLDARRFSLDLGPVEVADVATDVVDGFRGDVATSEVELTVVAPEAAWGRSDHDRLGQVLGNLVENALKFARSQVAVEVTALPGGPAGRPLAVQIAVTDDGPGITPDDLPHVFERLYVATKVPVRKEVGSGLGLAIVRELVDAMGGRVWAESPEEGGTRFVVILHGADAVVPDGAAPDRVAGPDEPDQTSGSSTTRADAKPSPQSTDTSAGTSTFLGT
jgi:two-component system sensor histidine kinase BaeS